VTDCYLPRLGGIEMHVRDLAERQVAAGHDVTVVTSTRATDPGQRSGQVTVVRVDGSRTQPGRIGYRHSLLGRRVLGDGAFDVVHVHASAFSPLSFLAAHYAYHHRTPTVVTVHSLWAGATPLFRVANLLTGWAAWPLEWSTVSEVAAAGLRRMVGPAPVTVVPDGVDSVAWRVTPLVRDRHELRLVAVGRLAKRKRTLHLAKLLLDAQRRLPQGTHLTMEIIGDGPERRRLERYLRHHGMDAWVRLRGALSREEIRATFARSDLYVAPAVLESFGIAALEARCSGLPILARAGTGIQDFLFHGIDGWLVDSDHAMADTIVDLAHERDRLDRVAAHNRSTDPGDTWPTVLRACETLYQRAAVRHSKAWSVVAAADDTAVAVASP
jgi:glycosyltransferase involved in cell wall biosynthesis